MLQIYNNIYISEFHQFCQNEIFNSLEEKIWFATKMIANNIC
jgi:hypothetical protein